ncbi:MAG: SPOR domain-containing protein [Candidatus Thiodiazotropha sp. (ex Lucinoma aequizonata)]|nr:SPOR domain-containing protein [Candidatus Thiodiazotropha sp. (ex Lucinoma aequizonata)]MCU7887676.1 SPOR domain-containing protein [Candidatus Thiodiazotropha sp. (ex Lucinoma aequizonata)]MCU7893916.1 SPOR domain-containing protein [Candidatus Thiodiazotropha sp. (ex Lucinoma aequizonata)]MCU7898567.1 SPOR domain-containing protein [Candidatus Thiodiazotropha sp. (ex Lucinoma aequizonata)]MCU7901668.1 SPOR domain-containing protein [Candidatus Thiodiazotropha sp. (ex Lucinoma aequizonata)
MALEERLKQRLLGGAVFVALIVVFVPMLIDDPVETQIVFDHTISAKAPIKERPAVQIVPQTKSEKTTPSKTTARVEPKRVPASKTVPETTSQPKFKPKSEVPAAKGKSSPTVWMIQVASLTNEQNAKKLLASLRKADLPAQMERVKLDGKQHYRVRVGPEVDHGLAEKMLAKIKKTFKLYPKLMRYPE